MSFDQARACVIERVLAERCLHPRKLRWSAGRPRAGEEIRADRDYPALARSVRDGFAVRAADVQARSRVIGEVRAERFFAGQVGTGEVSRS